MAVEALVKRCVSVFGPFASRALVEMSIEEAAEVLGEPPSASGRTAVIDGVESELEAMRERAPEVGSSALSASAVALAYELEHPYNSATSKAACAKELRETFDRLRELLPPVREADKVDDLGERRAKRLARGAAPAG